VSIIANVHHNSVKRYSWNNTIGYMASTHSKHRNTQYDFIKDFILGFFFILNSFLTTKGHAVA
jgi:hypothetical protein